MWEGMVNKGSHFADFVRFRPHTFNLHAQSTISAALMAAIKFKGNAQFIFLCNPQKSSVNVFLIKILIRTVTKK